MINAVEKRKLISSLKYIRKPNKTYTYDIFSALIYILIAGEKISEVEIDKEYPGHEISIKERLIQYFQTGKVNTPEISFVLVGKHSNSHIRALKVFQGKEKPGIMVNAKKVLEVIYSNKKGWRPRSSRRNP